jgi:hypothetical protein
MRSEILLLCFGLASIFTGFGATELRADQPNSKVLKHIVLYKFRDGLSAAEIDEVVQAFRMLPKQIDTVIGFEHGTNVSQEGKSEGLTHAFVVSFRDEKGRDAYIAHPAHQEYVKLARTRRERAVVVDFWAEP